MSEIRPFQVNVDEAVLEDLRARLDRARLPDQLPGDPWGYGTDGAYLKELCDYWRNDFDWRAVEKRMNATPQFVTEIDGQQVYFQHHLSPEADAMPLLLTHGWPGSVLEFEKILPMLTHPTEHGGRKEDAFHVVVPAIPGYGWSGPTREQGWGSERSARAFMVLMERLGYGRYFAQGGDWGAIITTQVGRLDPEHCAGIHVNMAVPLPPSADDPLAGLTDAEKQQVADFQVFQAQEMGYFYIQASKPQTLAFGLTDSPVGLAAWIVEKFRAWSDCHGDVESRFSKDELLATVTLYWVTETIASSMRFYFETQQGAQFGYNQGRIEVPSGFAIFPAEPYCGPRTWAEQCYNLQAWQKQPRGGHFAAMEEPALLAGAMREFFTPLR